MLKGEKQRGQGKGNWVCWRVGQFPEIKQSERGWPHWFEPTPETKTEMHQVDKSVPGKRMARAKALRLSVPGTCEECKGTLWQGPSEQREVVGQRLERNKLLLSDGTIAT